MLNNSTTPPLFFSLRHIVRNVRVEGVGFYRPVGIKPDIKVRRLLRSENAEVIIQISPGEITAFYPGAVGQTKKLFHITLSGLADQNRFDRLRTERLSHRDTPSAGA